MAPNQTTMVDTGTYQTIQGLNQQGVIISIQVPIYLFVADPTEYSSPIDRQSFRVVTEQHVLNSFPNMRRLLAGSQQVRMLALADEVVVPRRYMADPRLVYSVDTIPPSTPIVTTTIAGAAPASAATALSGLASTWESRLYEPSMFTLPQPSVATVNTPSATSTGFPSMTSMTPPSRQLAGPLPFQMYAHAVATPANIKESVVIPVINIPRPSLPPLPNTVRAPLNPLYQAHLPSLPPAPYGLALPSFCTTGLFSVGMTPISGALALAVPTFRRSSTGKATLRQAVLLGAPNTSPTNGEEFALSSTNSLHAARIPIPGGVFSIRSPSVTPTPQFTTASPTMTSTFATMPLPNWDSSSVWSHTTRLSSDHDSQGTTAGGDNTIVNEKVTLTNLKTTSTKGTLSENIFVSLQDSSLLETPIGGLLPLPSVPVNHVPVAIGQFSGNLLLAGASPPTVALPLSAFESAKTPLTTLPSTTTLNLAPVMLAHSDVTSTQPCSTEIGGFSTNQGTSSSRAPPITPKAAATASGWSRLTPRNSTGRSWTHRRFEPFPSVAHRRSQSLSTLSSSTTMHVYPVCSSTSDTLPPASSAAPVPRPTCPPFPPIDTGTVSETVATAAAPSDPTPDATTSSISPPVPRRRRRTERLALPTRRSERIATKRDAEAAAAAAVAVLSQAASDRSPCPSPSLKRGKQKLRTSPVLDPENFCVTKKRKLR